MKEGEGGGDSRGAAWGCYGGGGAWGRCSLVRVLCSCIGVAGREEAGNRRNEKKRRKKERKKRKRRKRKEKKEKMEKFPNLKIFEK
jgi:hypothetical protein